MLDDLGHLFYLQKQALEKRKECHCNFCLKKSDPKQRDSGNEKQGVDDGRRGVVSDDGTAQKDPTATQWPGSRHYPYLVNEYLQEWASKPQPMRLPMITAVRKSWDYVPPDVLKPLAVTDASSILRIGHALGMIWTVFRPGTGDYRAEGNDRSFVSYRIQGVGTVVQYHQTSQHTTARVSSSIHPSTDLLACGIIRPYLFVNHEFGIKDTDSVIRSLDDLFTEHVGRRPPKKAIDLIERNSRHKWLGPVNDLVPLKMPCLSHPMSDTNFLSTKRPKITIPYPNPGIIGVVGYMFKVFLTHALNHFTRRPRYAVDLQDRAAYDRLKVSDDPKDRAFLIAWSRMFQEPSFDQTFRLCEDFLQNCSAFDQSFGCYISICAHLNFVYAKWDYYSGVRLPEKLDYLFGHLQELTKLVHDEWRKRNKDSPNNDTIEDAWIIMMLRAYCWRQMHKMQKCELVEESALYSKLPVYLT